MYTDSSIFMNVYYINKLPNMFDFWFLSWKITFFPEIKNWLMKYSLYLLKNVNKQILENGLLALIRF